MSGIRGERSKFRKHRGGLAESLATEVEVESLDEVLKLCNETSLIRGLFSKPRCEYYARDDRGIDYDDTYIVTAQLGVVTEDRIVLGFSNQMLK